MDKPKKTQGDKQHVPQIRVRSALTAGQSLEACVSSLNDWQKQYKSRCKKEGVDVNITPYTI
jgi:DNA-binding HxlR family transcriptional regulator